MHLRFILMIYSIPAFDGLLFSIVILVEYLYYTLSFQLNRCTYLVHTLIGHFIRNTDQVGAFCRFIVTDCSPSAQFISPSLPSVFRCTVRGCRSSLFCAQFASVQFDTHWGPKQKLITNEIMFIFNNYSSKYVNQLSYT